MYVKVLEIAIGAAAVAASLVSAIVSTGEPRSVAVVSSVRVSVVCLIICIVFSLVTIMGLSRGYDRARSRFLGSAEGSVYQDQGMLDDAELRLILATGYFSLAGFLTGFVFLARITFQI